MREAASASSPVRTVPRHRCRPLPLGLFAGIIASAGFLSACDANPATTPLQPDAAARASLTSAVVNAVAVPMSPNDVLTTINGVTAYHGGYGSALAQRPGRPDVFYSLTDRGPNIGGSGNDKLFVAPDFHPQVG